MVDENLLRFLVVDRRIDNIENSSLRPLYKKLRGGAMVSALKRWAYQRRRVAVPRPLHLYVHVPLCQQKCLYCHCATQTFVSPRQWKDCRDHIVAQVRAWAPALPGVAMESLFVGGGTPSILPDKDLRDLFCLFKKHFILRDGAQVSVEVNPSSVTPSKVAVLKECGVNRVSVGVQSFDPKVLAAIRRPQTLQQAQRAVAMFQDAGIKALNIDLMAGLPEQTERSFLRSLAMAVALKPGSIQVNPFCDVQQSMYFKAHPHMPILAMFLARTRMLNLAKRYLVSQKYRGGGFGFFYREGHGMFHAQYEGLAQDNHSVLGFGPQAQSRLVGVGNFMARPLQGPSQGIIYEGVRVEEGFYMAAFLEKNLWDGIRLNRFRQVFGRDIKDVFPKELVWLKRKRMIMEKKGMLSYAGKRDARGAFEYFSCVKVFYGQKMLSALGKGYRPKINYGYTSDAFIKKMQDVVFTMTANGMGFRSAV